jgi:hypothetical protein
LNVKISGIKKNQYFIVKYWLSVACKKGRSFLKAYLYKLLASLIKQRERKILEPGQVFLPLRK